MNSIYLEIKKNLEEHSTSRLLISKTKTHTYSDLNLEINNFSKIFDKASVKAKNAICVFLPNSLEFISTLVTCIKYNVTFIPFKGLAINNKIAINFLKPEYLIIKKEEADSFLKFTHYSLSKELILIKINENSFSTKIKNLTFIRMTSGTTGNPKAVMISSNTALDRIKTAQKVLNINNKSIIGWPMDMAYHFIVSIVLYLLNGACIKLIDLKDLNQAKSELKDINCLYASPREINFIYENLEELNPTIQKIYSTAYQLNPNLIDKFVNKFKVELIQLYGMIEVGLPFYGTYKNSAKEYWGTPAPDFEFKLENLEGDNTTNQGKLFVKGPGIFNGYFGEEINKNDWFETGDIARVKDDKIKILGRQKSSFIFYNNLIFPEIIEGLINTEFNLIESKISKISKELLLIKIIANNKLNLLEISRFVADFLNIKASSLKLEITDKLDKTLSGKIKR